MNSLVSLRRMFAWPGPPSADHADVDEFPENTLEPAQGRAGGWRANRGVQLAAAIPFVVAAVLSLVPGYYDGLYVAPPDIIGVPAGLVFLAVTLGWALLGAAVVGQTRFRVMAALALTICTIPAAIGVVLMPQLIFVMQNLSV